MKETVHDEASRCGRASYSARILISADSHHQPRRGVPFELHDRGERQLVAGGVPVRRVAVLFAEPRAGVKGDYMGWHS